MRNIMYHLQQNRSCD